MHLVSGYDPSYLCVTQWLLGGLACSDSFLIHLSVKLAGGEKESKWRHNAIQSKPRKQNVNNRKTQGGNGGTISPGKKKSKRPRDKHTAWEEEEEEEEEEKEEEEGEEAKRRRG